MGWIDIEKQMPPMELRVLLELSGTCFGENEITLYADHDYCLGSWIVPSGEKDGEWLIDSSNEFTHPTVHAWMPLPKHYQQKEYAYAPEPDMMEHAMFEDDPDWLYKGDCVYEQMSLEDFMKGVEA